MSKIKVIEEADDILKDAEQAELHCRVTENRVEQAKTELKAAKEEYDEAVIDLRRIAATRLESNPLLDQ
jgi:hypothetical protein